MSKYPRNNWTQFDWFSSEWLDRPMLKFREGKITTNTECLPQSQEEWTDDGCHCGEENTHPIEETKTCYSGHSLIWVTRHHEFHFNMSQLLHNIYRMFRTSQSQQRPSAASWDHHRVFCRTESVNYQVSCCSEFTPAVFSTSNRCPDPGTVKSPSIKSLTCFAKLLKISHFWCHQRALRPPHASPRLEGKPFLPDVRSFRMTPAVLDNKQVSKWAVNGLFEDFCQCF